MEISFMPNIKWFRHKIIIQLNNTSLVIDQNKLSTKTVNADIVYDEDNCPNIRFWNFITKNFLFGATNIAQNNDKSKWVYSCIEIAFDGNIKSYFANGSAGKVLVFGVNNSSSSSTINYKNGCLVLDEGDTFGIFGGFSATEKSLVLILVTQR